MESNGSAWGLVTILGPLLLVAILAWAALRNRTSKRDRSRTEQATKELYKEEEAARDKETDLP